MLRVRALLVALLMVSLAGCTDLFDSINRPDYSVRATPLDATGWNRDGEFRVVVEEPVEVHITATSATGARVEDRGIQEARIVVPDGTWDIAYTVGGHKWLEHDGVRFDATPPAFVGLKLVGDAAAGAYTIGEGARVEGASSLRVIDLQQGTTVGTAIPVRVSGLADGLHAFLLTARDEAGNTANATVQVRVGSATELPDGRYTFGVVARYNNDVELWDLRDPSRYLARPAARAAQPSYLGKGFGIDPEAPAVRAAAGSVVTEGMTTMEASLALFKWFAGELEYDETRLDSEHLLTPTQVILDREDRAGRDANEDGLVDDGGGNGVKGGICRDLAATYVSLLRAAGVPARLVSGYVGGEVDGFHAWVEFYAGTVDGQDPWVPVDVSTIDGPYQDAVLMQSFGIRLPEYLPLRAVPADAEVEGWSTAIGVRYKWPEDKPDPRVEFRKQVADDLSQVGVLCFDPATRARATAPAGPSGSRGSHCGAAYDYFLADFLLSTQRTIDYGIEVVSAPPGTTVTAEVAYPVGQDGVPFLFYGKPFTKDVANGKAISQFTV